MRIAINCRSFLRKQYTGIGRYAYHLVKSLGEIDPRNQYELYVRKGVFSFNKKIPRFPSKNFISRVDWFGRGPEKILKNIDVFHIPSPGPMQVPGGAKAVVTVHDIIFKAFPESHTPETIEAGEREFDEIRKKADKIICCSVNTANDLKKYFQVPDRRIAVIYQGVDQSDFRPLNSDEKVLAGKELVRRGIEDPFILSVGTIEPRKNLVNSIKAFGILRAQKKFSGDLVVIGRKGWMREDVSALIEKLGLKRNIVFLGYVPDRELRYFYATAEAFIFPSFYEGFGFPIVEAFACGAPVVTSDRSSCSEIAGDAALTVDPSSPDAIAGAVGRILHDRDLQRVLREKGFERASRFDFHTTAEETLKVYEEVGRS